MATPAQQVPPSYINLPSGLGDDKQAPVNPRSTAMVRLVEMVASERGGEEPVYTDLAKIPLGTKSLYTQRRMAGDFYCAIEGTRHVSGVGATLGEAFLAALKRARA